MSVTADTLRKLASLGLGAEQLAGVLDIIADIQEVDEKRRAAGRDRVRRHREKRACNVTETLQPRYTPPDGPPSPQTPIPPLTPQTTDADASVFRAPSGSKAEKGEAEAEFTALAKAYPRRKGGNPLKPARVKFDAALRRGVPAATILAAARSFAAECAGDGRAGTEFVPMLSTWLNQERWQQIEPETCADPPPVVAPPGARSSEEIRAEWLAKMEAKRAAEQQSQPAREDRRDEVQTLPLGVSALHRGHAVGRA